MKLIAHVEGAPRALQASRHMPIGAAAPNSLSPNATSIWTAPLEQGGAPCCR